MKQRTFYLMDNLVERRVMIDSKQHAGCPVIDTTQAQSWIEAKQGFGFDLTGLQAMMIESLSSDRAVSRATA